MSETEEKLRFETPYNNTIFNNANRFIINHVIGDPKKYPENQHEGTSAFVKCFRCDGIYFWDGIIVVRYNEEDYGRNNYCRNCFERAFPRWKRFLINHFNYFNQKYRKIEGHPYSNFYDFKLEHYKNEPVNIGGVPLIFSKNRRYK